MADTFAPTGTQVAAPTSYYEVPEKEFDRLYEVVEQMRLVVQCIGPTKLDITCTALHSFLDARCNEIDQIVAASKGNFCIRKETPATQEPAGIPFDLAVRLMEAFSSSPDEDTLVKLGEDLHDATVPLGQIEPLRTWYAALKRQGYKVKFTGGEDSHFSIRRPKAKRDKASRKHERQDAEPVDFFDFIAKYGNTKEATKRYREHVRKHGEPRPIVGTPDKLTTDLG